MINNYSFLLGIICLFLFHIQARPDSLEVVAQAHQKMPIMLVMVGKGPHLQEVGALVQKALEFKEQCIVTMISTEQMMTKQELLEARKNGFIYVLAIQEKPHAFEWHSFDLSIAKNILSQGKKVTKQTKVVRAWAYALADSLWHSLTNEPPIFSTKIAYAKEIPLKNGRHYSHIYITDYDGSNPQLLVKAPTINNDPQWNNDASRPLLFYSENKNANVPLMAIDMQGKKTVASNFEGLNMLPAFCPDGKSVVYCATRGSGSCQLYHWSHNALKKLTHNMGNNFDPAFADNKTLYFSSDFEAGKPQIYMLSLEDGNITRITHDGYCVSPSFCAAKNKLAYAKMMDGVMQLFCYDPANNIHKQLTFDAAQKEECAWSACGTYLLCPVDMGKKSRIAFFNVNAGTYTYITDSVSRCNCPAWSRVYNEYPVMS